MSFAPLTAVNCKERPIFSYSVLEVCVILVLKITFLTINSQNMQQFINLKEENLGLS